MLELRDYLDLSLADVVAQWMQILNRNWMPAGVRQADFLPVETLLCFGLGLIGTRSRSGTINISERAEPVVKLSLIVKRSPASLAAKLANLDGRRPHSAKYERLLWAELTENLYLFDALYERIFDGARLCGISTSQLPDFLGQESASLRAVLEADRVSTDELRESIDDEFITWHTANPGTDAYATERAMVGTARVSQQQFARAVLSNSGLACAFCGLSFPSAGLPSSRMLVASHIKPWRISSNEERTDPRNGLAACPTHDAAFDGLLMSITSDLLIDLSPSLRLAVEGDPLVARNFGPTGMRRSLVAPLGAPPGEVYLSWHRNAMLQSSA